MKKQISRRDFLRVSAVVGAGGFLAACGQPTASPAPVTTEPPVQEKATEVPKPASEMVMRLVHSTFDMDWSPMRGGGHFSRLYSLWWAAPLYFDSKGELKPFVFKEWSANSDHTAWTFKIDPKAVFSDGSPITAEDVKGTWELSARPATKHQRVTLFIGGVKGIEPVLAGTANEISGLVVKDPQTLEVTLNASDPVFHMKIATALIAPVKISQARGADGEEIVEWWHPKNGVAVSGPFMPESMDLDKGDLVFVRNPNFFGPTPKIDKILIRSVDNYQTMTTMLQNKEVDCSTYIATPTLVDDLGADFVAGAMIPKGQHFWIDANKEPTNDINVRKALVMSIDRKEMFNVSFPKGPGEPSTQVLNAVAGVDPNYEDFPFDPEGAKKALAESSYGSAATLPKIMLVGISFPAAETAAQYIAEQWRSVLGITQVEFKPQYDDYSGPDQERIQFFRDDVAVRFPDAASYLQGAIHSASGNAQSKMGGYKNPEVDRLLDEAAMKGTDDPDRDKLAQQAQRLFRDDWMWLPWYYENMPKWAHTWVKGWDKNADWQVAEPWNATVEPQ